VAASRYRIVLRGRLSQRFESAFDGMTLEHGPNRTVLVGDVRDQAQLYGLLDRLQEFGIELLAVEPADISDGSSEPGGGLLPEIGPTAWSDKPMAGPVGPAISSLPLVSVRDCEPRAIRPRRPGTRPKSRAENLDADLHLQRIKPLVVTAWTRAAARALSSQELAHRRAPG